MKRELMDEIVREGVLSQFMSEMAVKKGPDELVETLKAINKNLYVIARAEQWKVVRDVCDKVTASWSQLASRPPE